MGRISAAASRIRSVGHGSKKGHGNAASKKCRASGSDDRQGESRESGRRRQAGIAYIESLPEPQKSIAKHVDALASKALPDLKRAVKWGMAYYGVPDGWCFTSGAFVGHLKLMFIRGNELQPEPPVTPIGMGKATRGVELTAMDELDEDQVLSWMAQAAEKPFVGGKKKK